MFFVTLMSPSTVTDKPSKDKGTVSIEYLKKLKAEPPKDIDIHGVYFPLGRFDGVIPFDAPDLVTAMRFAVGVGMTTGVRVETLPLVPIEQL